MFSFKNKRNNNNWTMEEKIEIVELNKNNVPISEIAERYKGRNTKAIINILRRMGWKVNNTK